MKLRTKSAIILVGLLIVLSGVNVAALAYYQGQLVQQERQGVETTADDAANQIEERIQTRKDTVGLYAQQHPDPGRLNESRPFLRSAFAQSRFWSSYVVNDSGNVVSVYGGYDEEGRREFLGDNVSDEPYVRQALESGLVVVSSPQNITNRSNPSLSFAAPIRDENRTIVGVLVARLFVNERSLLPMLEPLQRRGEQGVRVTDQDGETLYASLYEFNESVTGSAQLEEYGWTVTVTRNQAPLNETLREIALLQGAGLIVIFGSVAGFGVWQYRANLRQTERLLDGFNRIRGGNYEYRLEMVNAEEWRQISRGFNDLAEGLAVREAELREREQRLGVLNRVLRHNLRNEMSIILNYAEILREMVDDDQQQMAADTIVDTGQKLANLGEKARQIEEALDDDQAELERQDVVEMLEDVLTDMREDHPEATIELDAPPEQEVAAITSLWIAIRNVCENALKHNDTDDPHVRATVEPVTHAGQDRVLVSVADNGPGIPDQERNTLLEGEESALQHGSGLGLWLIYWVVDRSEGNLIFEDNDPRGAVVTMDLHADVPGDDVGAPADPSALVGEDATVVTREETPAEGVGADDEATAAADD
jgi:signal transduction histidine kinase